MEAGTGTPRARQGTVAAGHAGRAASLSRGVRAAAGHAVLRCGLQFAPGIRSVARGR